MKKILLALLLWPSLSFAGGPLYTYPSPPSPPGLDQEMQNIYHNISYPTINTATINAETVTASTITHLTLGTLGANPMDAAAFSQLSNNFIQYSSATTQTTTSTTSTSFVSATNMTVTITPTSASHQILLIVFGEFTSGSTTLGADSFLTITRNGTNLGTSDGLGYIVNTISSATADTEQPVTLMVIDNPASITSVTYQLQIRSSAGTTTTAWERDTLPAYMIAAEIL